MCRKINLKWDSVGCVMRHRGWLEYLGIKIDLFLGETTPPYRNPQRWLGWMFYDGGQEYCASMPLGTYQYGWGTLKEVGEDINNNLDVRDPRVQAIINNVKKYIDGMEDD